MPSVQLVALEVRVKVFNIAIAARTRRLPHYELARKVGMSEWRFSRALQGRSEFSSDERRRIAEVLGYAEEWLFATVVPPPVKQESVEVPART